MSFKMLRFVVPIFVVLQAIAVERVCWGQTKGGWVLTKVQKQAHLDKVGWADVTKGGFKLSNDKYTVHDFTETSAKLTHIGSHMDKLIEVHSMHGWSRPPDVIRPGDKVKSDLMVDVTLVKAQWGAHHGIGTTLRLDTDRGGPVFTNETEFKKPVKVSGQIQVNFPTTKKVSETIEWKPPGQTKNLFLTVAAQVVRVNFIYEWRDDPKPIALPPDQVLNPSPADKTPSDKSSTDKTSVDKTSSGKSPTDKAPTDKEATPPITIEEPANVSRMTLQAVRRTVPQGESVTIPIWLLKAQGVANLNFNLKYDPNVAKATGTFAKGNLLDKALFEANPQESGMVRVGFAQNSDLSGYGTVAQITFQANGAPGTKTPLTLEVTTISSANSGKPSIDLIHGEIVVVGKDGTLPGDSDGDLQVTARDAGDALKMSVKLIPVKMVCDVDQDGQVTSTDARLILAKASGK